MPVIEVKAEITGSVWKIEVNVGDKVTEEDVLLIMESMKMEIPLVARDNGMVKEIRVNEGDVVTEGDVTVILEA
jgi:acetyl-CoA carboxylase biotin carboxyl carrier protein